MWFVAWLPPMILWAAPTSVVAPSNYRYTAQHGERESGYNPLGVFVILRLLLWAGYIVHFHKQVIQAEEADQVVASLCVAVFPPTSFASPVNYSQLHIIICSYIPFHSAVLAINFLWGHSASRKKSGLAYLFSTHQHHHIAVTGATTLQFYWSELDSIFYYTLRPWNSTFALY